MESAAGLHRNTQVAMHGVQFPVIRRLISDKKYEEVFLNIYPYNDGLVNLWLHYDT
jgi:hypothetical protein